MVAAEAVVPPRPPKNNARSQCCATPRRVAQFAKHSHTHTHTHTAQN